nr:FtsK/SpoIIIE domain-containing protein [Leifsonia psychrotolerans]
MRSPEQAELVRSAAGQRSLVFSPDLASVVEAARHATELCRSADAAGISQLRDVVPSSVQLRDIGVTADQPHPSSARGRGLDCAVGLSADGPLCIDLVRQGPHAVVGGTTGSGKSELLVTWIVAMAARYPPDEVTFLLVDFKGGAALSALTTLPHCVGLVTDLDEHEATRALESLTAELRYREQILADAGAREIGDARIVPSVPRLVIVVDEFATMLGAFPDLHALFVDIAARGRSLGVHLILCTQRPAGVVRDALLANCSLRLSLRVNNRADSLAVIGTDAAASLAPTLPGRVLIKCGVGDPRLCQIATTSVDDIQQIIGRAHDASAGEPRGDRARRPWLPPLPPMVTREVLAAVAAGGPAAEAGADELQIGLFDEPAHQRYRVAGYAPTRHGHLLVVGAAHSGKSAALAMMAEQARKTAHPVGLVELVDADIENTWDALDRAHRRCLDPDATTPGLLLLLDDFDSVYARWESDYRLAALDLLTIVLRDGAAAGITLVIAVQRAVGGLQILSTLCGSALLLRMQNLDEHRAAGGVPARFDTTLPAGGGSWRGTRIQLLAALDPTGGRARPQPLPGLSAQSTLVLISGSPARCVERLREIRGEVATVVELTPPLGGARGQLDVTALIGPTAFVGDPDAWQIEWAALQLLRQRSPLIFDRCTLADYRLISRRREVPPPLAPGRNRVWVLEPDGHVHRGSVESGR